MLYKIGLFWALEASSKEEKWPKYITFRGYHPMGSVCGRGSGERKDEREEKELSRVEGFNSRRSSNRFYCLEHILLQLIYMARRRSTLETGAVQLCFTNHEPTRKLRNWVTTYCFQVKKNKISLYWERTQFQEEQRWDVVTKDSEKYSRKTQAQRLHCKHQLSSCEIHTTKM